MNLTRICRQVSNKSAGSNEKLNSSVKTCDTILQTECRQPTSQHLLLDGTGTFPKIICKSSKVGTTVNCLDKIKEKEWEQTKCLGNLLLQFLESGVDTRADENKNSWKTVFAIDLLCHVDDTATNAVLFHFSHFLLHRSDHQHADCQCWRRHGTHARAVRCQCNLPAQCIHLLILPTWRNYQVKS